MKRGRFCFTAAAVCLMVFGLSMSAQAKTTYRLEITNQYDTGGTSRDDNDKERNIPWSRTWKCLRIPLMRWSWHPMWSGLRTPSIGARAMK